MKLNLTKNGKGRGLGNFRSTLDFFFPYPKHKDGVGIIRHEAFTSVDSDGIHREFSTFRAFARHYTSLYPLKQFFSQEQREKVAEHWGVAPRLAYQVGAIAFDALTDQGGTNGVTNVTWSHTVTGTDPILFMGGFNNSAGSNVFTAFTYNSVSLAALLDTDGSGQNYRNQLLAWLQGPSTGANTASLTCTGGAFLQGWTSSYSGGKQTGAIDATSKTTGAQNPASLTGTITVVGTNCWVVASGRTSNGTSSAGTGLTLRGTVANSHYFGDSNGTVAAGAYSQTVTTDAAPPQDIAMLQASFLPVAAGGGAANHWLLTGV